MDLMQEPISKESEKSKTIRIVLLVVGIASILICGIFFLVSSVILKSEPYKISVQAIENSEEIKSEIGEVEGYGVIPTGEINITNGVGNANLCILVKGSKKEKTVCTIKQFG